MTTIFYKDKLEKWSKFLPYNKIKYGDPVIIEYKRIKLVSTKFDIFGKSQIMIVNYVKTVQTKEKTVQSITYYDENVIPNEPWYKKKKSFSIGPFDPSEYGNPICFYSPGFQNEEIIINTQFWEIDKDSVLKDSFKTLQGCISFGNVTPYAPYFELANELVGYSGKIITSLIKHKEMSKEHIIDFENDDIYIGTYICLPLVKDVNVRNKIIQDYYVEDDMLLKIENDKIIEYDDTYFILEISSQKRDDLASFDYISSSAELISLFNENNSNFMTKLNNSMDMAYNMGLIEKINEAYQNNDMVIANALAKHIPLAKKNWYKTLFPNLD